MKKILAFCFFPAFVPPSNGGETRLFNFYKALSRKYHVTLLTSTHLGVEEEVINHGATFIERRIPKDGHFIQCYTELEKYGNGGGDISGPALFACGTLPTGLHRAYMEEYANADVIFHDFPFTVDYDLFIGTDTKPRIYNAHNCETNLYAQLHLGEKSRFIHDLVRRAEMRMLMSADAVLYCNENDLVAFRENAPEASFQAIYAPNGMTLYPEKQVRLNRSEQFHAVFVGSGHPPNVKAANFIADYLAVALPNIAFDIIGSCLPEGNYPANVKRHGVIDQAEKGEILSRADLALNPMEGGSGSNVKVLEYFAYGIPVLSTPFGMRGIHAAAGKEYLEASLPDFVEAIRHSANEPDALASVGNEGRALAQRAYTWEAIAQPVVECIEVLTKGEQAVEQSGFIIALNDYDSFDGIGGGGTRTRGLYEAAQLWSPVVFVCFSKDNTLRARRYTDRIVVLNVPKTFEHLADLAQVNSQYHVSADDVVASRHCAINPWLNEVYRILRSSARCVVVEHCYLAELPLVWGDRFIYSSQNNESDLKRRLLTGHPLKDELLPQVEYIERLAVERSAAVVAVSNEDATSLVKGKRSAGPVIVVRNGAATPATGEEVARKKEQIGDQIGSRAILFLGSAHMPNVEAAKYIVERLALDVPDVHFHILGSVCSAILRNPNNVRLWGVVDDVTKSAVMESCDLALNPMGTGSGSNVKVADYLAHGLFVLTTEFGQRGYPDSIQKNLTVAPLDRFAKEIQRLVGQPQLFSTDAKQARRSLFEAELAMCSLAERFVTTLQNLEERKRRVLYVTYRYTAPALGGAEVNIEKFVRALGASGNFHVDIVSPEVTGIHNHLRFSESYTFDGESSVPIDIPNVRFARFPADHPDEKETEAHLQKVWNVQPEFEKAVDRQVESMYLETGLTWGWGYPEGEGGVAARWSFTGCGMFLAKAAQVEVYGYAESRVVVTVYGGQYVLAGPQVVEGSFRLAFEAQRGRLEFSSSAPVVSDDPRPLAFKALKILIGGVRLDLSSLTLLEKAVRALPSDETFKVLDQAAADSRFKAGVHLTDGRGPWSAGLESFIRDQISGYDLVVAHNSVFRPTIVAMEEARKHGVPAVLVPHIHLDDDFYHFPDVLKAAQNASIVLTVPRAANEFLLKKGCNAQYFPAGCDATEQFTDADRDAFQKVYNSNRQFVLVLGRKAGAKGYRKIIDAVETLNREGIDLQTVLIGPDDDGIAVTSNNAIYLGLQPRNVVRGALLSSVALVNMSSSESFGIVLLEAWLAGKPVIANANCAAFHDMAVDGENSLLVAPDKIADAISTLLTQPDLSERLANNGRKTAELFDWANIVAKFVAVCEELTRSQCESEHH